MLLSTPHDVQLPALKSNRGDPVLGIPPNQAQAHQVQNPKVQSRGAISQPGRFNSRVGTGSEEITEVDMSNESILSMIIADWNLHPSYINLPVQTNNADITDDDLLELLAFLIPVEVF